MRQTRLRAKIHRHKTSQIHQQSKRTKEEATRNVLDNLAEKMLSSQVEATKNVIDCAYYVAKRNHPFTEFEALTTTLCRKVGVKVGHTMHHRKTGVKIVNHIAAELKRDFVKSIIESDVKFSVMIDESTSKGNDSLLIIYIRANIGGKTENHFLDIVHVGKTAVEILSALIRTLRRNGFTTEILKKNWIALGCDGASVLTGKKSGLIKLLEAQFPNVIMFHCLNHRLELALNDAVMEFQEFDKIKTLFDRIYS